MWHRTCNFFSIAAARGTVADPVWVNVAYFSLFLLFANYLVWLVDQGKEKIVIRGIIRAYVLNLSLVVLLVGQTIFSIINVFLSLLTATNINVSLPIENDTTKNFVGWNQTANQIVQILQKHKKPKFNYLLTREFQLSGSLSLYLPSHPFTHTIEKPERNQWSPDNVIRNKRILMICPEKDCNDLVEEALERFKNQGSFEKLGQFVTRVYDKSVRNLNVFWYEPKTL